jgi:hypothetical protein
MRNENDRAAGGAAVRAGIGNAGRHPDTTTQANTLDLADIRFRRAVARLHRLGPRSLYEMLAELGAQRLIRSEIEDLVEHYVDRLTPEMLLATGGDKFAPAPIHVVGTRP